MTRDVHQQARELIACAGAEEASDERSTWLQAHLQECAPCRDYAEAAAQLVRSLRSVPFMADAGLVRSTQLRVRSRALQLQQERERARMIWMSCALVALSGTVTTPLLWRGFEWLGELAEVSSSVWQAGFAVFWIAPALAASILLVARGIHLGGDSGVLKG